MIDKRCDDIMPILNPFIQEVDKGAKWLTSGDNYEWYYTYANIIKPESILEVGVRFGYSLIALIVGAQGSVKNVFMIDSEQEDEGCLDIAIGNVLKYDQSISLKKLNKDTFDISADDLPDCQYDIIHIDGNHKPDGILNDWGKFWNYLKPGGYLILDDMNSLAGEFMCPLFFHIMPRLYDGQDIDSWYFIQNYNKQLVVRKKCEVK